MANAHGPESGDPELIGLVTDGPGWSGLEPGGLEPGYLDLRGLEFRRASHPDNAAIVEFLASHAMEAGLALRFDRSPDFFALHAAQSNRYETLLLLERQRIVGMGSLVFRPGYIDGAPEQIAYLAELRVSGGRKIAGLWRRLLSERIASSGGEPQARYGYCCIIRDNRLARASVLRSRADDVLRFEHLRGYSNVSLLARKPWVRRHDKTVSIRRAGPSDSQRLRRFIDSDSASRPFGVVFDEATWQHRLEHWPGFGIENFYLAFDAANRLLGCLAPWDSSAINRIVIDRMPTALNAIRVAYNALAALRGRARIAVGAGSHLPDIALTHVHVDNRDPNVLQALLDTAYRDIAKTGRHATLSLCVYDADPLAPALAGYWHQAIPMDLYWLKLDPAAGPLPVPADRMPGFESYLV